MSNKTYDILKFIAQIVLPALATFYITVSKFWNLPYPEEIGGTIIAIDTFLGALLGISSYEYNKAKKEELEEAKSLNGQLQQTNNEGK